MSTIALAEKRRSTSDHTRHINIRYFFVKDKNDSNELHIKYLPTDEMVADVLTKPVAHLPQWRRMPRGRVSKLFSLDSVTN